MKLHIILACVNFWIAAAMGLLIAFDKVGHFLPGYVIANVFAHAHLAALGWATMMVVGVAYRMLPMTFPSRMPSGRSMYASALLLESGVLGLIATLLLRASITAAFGIMIVAGLTAFGTRVVWMRRHTVSKPVGAPRVDFALLHAAAAATALAVAAIIGLVLLIRPASPALLRAAAAYGVLGLVGYLAQMVIAMETRLLPMVSWFWAYAASGYRTAPPSPHVMRDRSLQAVVFAAWTIAVPALALGMFVESAVLIAIGAWSLFAGVVVAGLDSGFVVARALTTANRASSQAA